MGKTCRQCVQKTYGTLTNLAFIVSDTSNDEAKSQEQKLRKKVDLAELEAELKTHEMHTKDMDFKSCLTRSSAKDKYRLETIVFQKLAKAAFFKDLGVRSFIEFDAGENQHKLYNATNSALDKLNAKYPGALRPNFAEKVFDCYRNDPQKIGYLKTVCKLANENRIPYALSCLIESQAYYCEIAHGEEGTTRKVLDTMKIGLDELVVQYHTIQVEEKTHIAQNDDAQNDNGNDWSEAIVNFLCCCCADSE